MTCTNKSGNSEQENTRRKVTLEAVGENTFMYGDMMIFHDNERAVLPQLILYFQDDMSEKERFNYLLDFIQIDDYAPNEHPLEHDFEIIKQDDSLTVVIDGLEWYYEVLDVNKVTDGYYTFEVIFVVEFLLSFTLKRMLLSL